MCKLLLHLFLIVEAKIDCPECKVINLAAEAIILEYSSKLLIVI